MFKTGSDILFRGGPLLHQRIAFICSTQNRLQTRSQRYQCVAKMRKDLFARRREDFAVLSSLTRQRQCRACAFEMLSTHLLPQTRNERGETKPCEIQRTQIGTFVSHVVCTVQGHSPTHLPFPSIMVSPSHTASLSERRVATHALPLASLEAGRHARHVTSSSPMRVLHVSHTA